MVEMTPEHYAESQSRALRLVLSVLRPEEEGEALAAIVFNEIEDRESAESVFLILAARLAEALVEHLGDEAAAVTEVELRSYLDMLERERKQD